MTGKRTVRWVPESEVTPAVLAEAWGVTGAGLDLLPDANAVTARVGQALTTAGKPSSSGLKFGVFVRVPSGAALLGAVRNRIREEYRGTVEPAVVPETGPPRDWEIFLIRLPYSEFV